MGRSKRRKRPAKPPAPRRTETWGEGDILCAVSLIPSGDADPGYDYQWYLKEPNHAGTKPTMTGPSTTWAGARESARLWAAAVSCPDPGAARDAAYAAYVQCCGVLAVTKGQSRAQELVLALHDAFAAGELPGSPDRVRVVRSEEELARLAAEAKRGSDELRESEARWRRLAEISR